MAQSPAARFAPQQLGQLSEIRRDSPRAVARSMRRASTARQQRGFIRVAM